STRRDWRRPRRHTAAERQQILDVLQQPPELAELAERMQDQSATWSLTLVQWRLRANGLPQVSWDTIHQTLRAADYIWQRTRTWRSTGATRRRWPSAIRRACSSAAVGWRKASNRTW